MLRRVQALYAIAFMLLLSVVVGLGGYHLGELLGMTNGFRVLGACLFGGVGVLFIYRPRAWMELETMPRWNKAEKLPEAPAAPASVATTAPRAQAAASSAPSQQQMHYYSMGYQQGVKDGVGQGYQAAVNKILGALGVELVPKEDAPAAPEVEEGEESPSSTPPTPIAPVAPAHECALCHHSPRAHEPLSAKGCFERGCKCTGYTEKLTIMQKIFNRS